MIERERAATAHRHALEIRDQLDALAEELGPLDTRKRDDRAIAEAVRSVTRAVEQLAARLGEIADDRDRSSGS